MGLKGWLGGQDLDIVVILGYAEDHVKNLKKFHLSFNPVKKAALFEMIDSNEKEFRLWLMLDGKFVESEFLN